MSNMVIALSQIAENGKHIFIRSKPRFGLESSPPNSINCGPARGSSEKALGGAIGLPSLEALPLGFVPNSGRPLEQPNGPFTALLW